MWKRIRFILLKIMNVISLLIILASIAVLLTVVTAKPGQAPNFLGYSLFRVMTGSMEPTIQTNSLIVVKRVDAAELAVGDIITFYSRDPSLMGEPNTHRILRFEEENGKRLIITKGDANNVEDRYPTQEEDLIGKVTYNSMFMGKLVRLISNPLVFIPLIMIPLVILLIRNIYDGIVAAKQLAKEEEEAAVREALAALREKKKSESEAEESETTDQEKLELEAEESETTDQKKLELEAEESETTDQEKLELEAEKDGTTDQEKSEQKTEAEENETTDQ